MANLARYSRNFGMKFRKRVSVKRGAGAGAGVEVGVGAGAGVGVGVTFYIFVMSFFLSFNPNSDFSQFASAVYRYNIFRYKGNKENKKNVLELLFSHHPEQSCHISVKTI